MEVMNEEKMLNVLAVNVSIHRKMKGISTERLSEIIGKNSNYIKKLEKFKLKRVPPLDVVYRISIVLNVTFEELLNQESIEKNNIGGNHV